VAAAADIRKAVAVATAVAAEVAAAAVTIKIIDHLYFINMLSILFINLVRIFLF
jgi:hypothetical protein